MVICIQALSSRAWRASDNWEAGLVGNVGCSFLKSIVVSSADDGAFSFCFSMA